MYDWDGNGEIDSYDIGQSISMGSYDEENYKDSPKGNEKPGCLSILLIMVIVIIGVYKIY